MNTFRIVATTGLCYSVYSLFTGHVLAGLLAIGIISLAWFLTEKWNKL